MTSLAWRAAANRIVATAEVGGGAEEATGEGKIKGRTSRLGRSVVLIGFFGPSAHIVDETRDVCTGEMPRNINDNCTSRRIS